MECFFKEMEAGMKGHGKIINLLALEYLFMQIKNLILTIEDLKCLLTIIGTKFSKEENKEIRKIAKGKGKIAQKIIVENITFEIVMGSECRT